MLYPALDIRCDPSDLLLAIVDDYSPTAVEERDDSVRVFFANARARDEARALLSAQFEVGAVDVPDEDWARRSQENLQPVTVGRLTIATASALARLSAVSHEPSAMTIVIEPSMGFGTGHHATTRLCLEALQGVDLRGKTVLDAGTGSGILAIAAARLGAAAVLGVDDDADAIQAARENLERNPAPAVSFRQGDLRSLALGTSDVVIANLTGALLVRSAPTLTGAARLPGTLILSGIQAPERDEVVRAFAGTLVDWERKDEEWVALNLRRPNPV
jgi:ribosomal protein L11 methyltransferase